jgi:DNA-binding NarL/FixJ family response regulator
MNASSTSLRLLVIEHQAGLRQVVRRWLEGLDCVICECVSPVEALLVSAQPGPDWVVVDAQSKPVNGLVALRELTSRFAKARFVLVSDVADEDLHKAALQAGACACLLKEELSTLRDLLTSKAGMEPSCGIQAPGAQTVNPAEQNKLNQKEIEI